MTCCIEENLIFVCVRGQLVVRKTFRTGKKNGISKQRDKNHLQIYCGNIMMGRYWLVIRMSVLFICWVILILLWEKKSVFMKCFFLPSTAQKHGIKKPKINFQSNCYFRQTTCSEILNQC